MATPQEHPETHPIAPKGSFAEYIALRTTSYVGSPLSLVVHSIFFVGIFSLQFFGFSFDQIMLILTTIVSLEAIYLSILIQITVNHQAHQIREVGEDVEEISEDVEEISKDIDDIQEDVEEISKDIDDIQEDVEEISEDVEEISKDVDDISEDVEDLTDELEKDEQEEAKDDAKIKKIEQALEELLREVKSLPRTHSQHDQLHHS